MSKDQAPYVEDASGTDRWSSRWGLLLAGIGMAVGTGNIWRFPRVCAKNGGGTFIMAWLIALVVWSLPLLITEMVMGKTTRRGPIGAFKEFLGERYTWMGAWVTWVTLAIMFYYSVVTGWCIRYFFFFLRGDIRVGMDTGAFWKSFINDPWQTVPAHLLALLLACCIIGLGVRRGIERANKVLLPGLFIMLVAMAVKALSLPGSGRGLAYLFSIDVAKFADASMWLEAFSQSAWSTGAGWGLLLTYSAYVSAREDIGQNCVIIGLGNNAASLIAALAILPTVGALASTQFVQVTSAGNTGMTFVWLAKLFPQMSGGRFFGSLFFLTLVFAAMSSLISMVELGTKVFIDMGWSRRKALVTIALVGCVLGIPSAVSHDFFNNQDWVWGVALLVSGVFIAFAAWRRGCAEIRETIINTEGNLLRIGPWWDTCITVAIPALFLVLTIWWVFQGAGGEKDLAWWWPLGVYTPGTVMVQWVIAGGALFLLNGVMARLQTKAPR